MPALLCCPTLIGAVAVLGIVPGVVGPGGIEWRRPNMGSGQIGRKPARDFDLRRCAGERAEGGDATDDIVLSPRIMSGGVALGDAFAGLVAAVVEVKGGHVFVGLPEEDSGRAQIGEPEFRG